MDHQSLNDSSLVFSAQRQTEDVTRSPNLTSVAIGGPAVEGRQGSRPNTDRGARFMLDYGSITMHRS